MKKAVVLLCAACIFFLMFWTLNQSQSFRVRLEADASTVPLTSAVDNRILQSNFHGPSRLRTHLGVLGSQPKVEISSTFSKIPEIIWQTSKSASVPAQGLSLSNSWLKHNPTWDYRFMDDGTASAFISENFDNLTITAFQSLPLGVMQADFWRIAVMYLYGGVYGDVDTECKRPIKEWLPPNCSVYIGLENSVHLCNWAFAAEPRHPVFKAILDLIVERVVASRGVLTENDNYVHVYTGPAVFTHAVRRWASMMKMSGKFAGQDPRDITLEQLYENQNLVPMFRNHGVCLDDASALNERNVENHYGSQRWEEDDGVWSKWIKMVHSDKVRSKAKQLRKKHFGIDTHDKQAYYMEHGCGQCTENVTLFGSDLMLINEAWSAQFGEGDYSTLGSYGAKDNDASSAIVPHGCTATLYENADYSGWFASLIPGHHSTADIEISGGEDNGATALRVRHSPCYYSRLWHGNLSPTAPGTGQVSPWWAVTIPPPPPPPVGTPPPLPPVVPTGDLSQPAGGHSTLSEECVPRKCDISCLSTAQVCCSMEWLVLEAVVAKLEQKKMLYVLTGSALEKAASLNSNSSTLESISIITSSKVITYLLSEPVKQRLAADDGLEVSATKDRATIRVCVSRLVGRSAVRCVAPKFCAPLEIVALSEGALEMGTVQWQVSTAQMGTRTYILPFDAMFPIRECLLAGHIYSCPHAPNQMQKAVAKVERQARISQLYDNFAQRDRSAPAAHRAAAIVVGTDVTDPR